MDPSSHLKEARKASKTATFLIDVAMTRAKDPHLLISTIKQLYTGMDNAITASLIIIRKRGLIPNVPTIDRYRSEVFEEVLVKEHGFNEEYPAAFRTVTKLNHAIEDKHIDLDANSLSLVISTEKGSVSVSRAQLKELSQLLAALVTDTDGLI